MAISTLFWSSLRALLSPDQLLQAASDCHTYSYDNGRHRHLPLAVVLAHSLEQVQAVVQLCHHHGVAITPRGRGTGTPGGAVAAHQGIVLSLERMTEILEFTPSNRSMRVQAGVLNHSVQQLAATQGLFWPPDPSSAAFCTIGGNLAYNAGGPKAVKYGSTRDHVLTIQAVTGTGELLTTGFATAKTACGYDLNRLLIGSEGTLAIMVEATLKLLPLQPAQATLQIWLDSPLAAAELVPALLACPAQPCAIEYLDQACLDLLRQHKELAIPTAAQALLMVEIDGLASAMPEAIDRLRAVCRTPACLAIDSATEAQARERLWQIRKALSPTLRQLAPYKINEDIVVPVHQLPRFLNQLQHLAQAFPFTLVNFGHIGSGNLHVNALVSSWEADTQQQVDRYLQQLFQLVLHLGGCLSGEHGIGLDKKPFMTAAFAPTTLALMRAIKQQFDPKGILNPDKLLP